MQLNTTLTVKYIISKKSIYIILFIFASLIFHEYETFFFVP